MDVSTLTAEDATELHRLAGLSTRPGLAAWLKEAAAFIASKSPAPAAPPAAPEGASAAPSPAAAASPSSTTALSTSTSSVPTSASPAPSSASPAPVPAAAPPAASSAASPPPAVLLGKAPVAAASSKVFFKPVPSYGWDQTSSAVKLYLSLPGVELLPQECININFASTNVNVQVMQLQGTNYSLALALAESITPAGCSFKTRNGKLIVTLKKASGGQWSYLTAAEKKKSDLSDIGKTDPNEDPNTSIMNMMRKLYDEGDDEMKRTIGKAFAESREKRSS